MNFNELVGKTLVSCDAKNDNDVILFVTTEGKTYQQYHDQDCCENVLVEDVCGSVDDIIGSPILQADEESTTPPSIFQHESATWTFYRISTIKGQVVIRWLGTSNGYYSESVSFNEVIL
jgi:hypothetical protein